MMEYLLVIFFGIWVSGAAFAAWIRVKKDYEDASKNKRGAR